MAEINTNSNVSPSSQKDRLGSFCTAFQSEILSSDEFRGDLCFIVKKDRIREMVSYLHKQHEPKFDVLLDIFAVDYLKYSKRPKERFAVFYQFRSLNHNLTVRLKVLLEEENLEIDSIHDLIAMANWFEREAWDLYGVRFKNHPNLQRILTHHDFEGHPLRKDYPSDGYQRLKTAAPSSGF